MSGQLTTVHDRTQALTGSNGALAHPPIGSLAGALASARDKCKGALKSSTNTFHKYKYAGADEIIATASDALEGSGLGLIPLTEELTVLGSGVTCIYALNRCLLLAHSSGETVLLEIRGWPVVPEKGRPLDKAYAIALTTSLSYKLRDLLQMPRVDPGDDVAAQRDNGQRQAAPPPQDVQALAPQCLESTPDPTPAVPSLTVQPQQPLQGNVTVMSVTPLPETVETITPEEEQTLILAARHHKRTVAEVSRICACLSVPVLSKAPRARLGWVTEALTQGLVPHSQIDRLTAELQRLGTDMAKVPDRLMVRFGVTSIGHLLKSQADLLEGQLRAMPTLSKVGA